MVRKVIKSALEGLTGGKFDEKRRKILKGTAAVGALAALPKGAKMLMKSVAKKLPENIKDVPAFKSLQEEFFRKTFRANIFSRDFHDAAAYYDDDDDLQRIFSTKDVHRILNKSIQNKMEATGKSFDEVAEEFIDSTPLIKSDYDEKYASSGLTVEDLAEHNQRWKDFFKSSPEEWDELARDQKLPTDAPAREFDSMIDQFDAMERMPTRLVNFKDWSWELLESDEVAKWMDADDASKALDVMKKAREADPSYEIQFTKDDIWERAKLEPWFEGKVPLRGAADDGLEGWNLDGDSPEYADYASFLESMMRDYGLSKQELADYLRKNKVIYQDLPDDVPTPKAVEALENVPRLRAQVEEAARKVELARQDPEAYKAELVEKYTK
tara:strand:- start:69 stop:1217 length:1149 start_codon:yes stop_codon:yes gene_type:complete